MTKKIPPHALIFVAIPLVSSNKLFILVYLFIDVMHHLSLDWIDSKFHSSSRNFQEPYDHHSARKDHFKKLMHKPAKAISLAFLYHLITLNLKT